jgi:transcriptional regulator with XRE-family HTH domain
MYGSRIRELRKEHKLTMKQLGQRMQLAESTISGYENEIRCPDLHVLIQFTEIFDVTVDYLIGRADQFKPYPQPVQSPAWLREKNVSFPVLMMDNHIDKLTDEEAAYLKVSLEMFRGWKASRQDSRT